MVQNETFRRNSDGQRSVNKGSNLALLDLSSIVKMEFLYFQYVSMGKKVVIIYQVKHTQVFLKIFPRQKNFQNFLNWNQGSLQKGNKSFPTLHWCEKVEMGKKYV